jgi:hypothetical protein
VVLSVPARNAQQLALDIAAPLLGVILFLSLIVCILLHLSTRQVARSLNNLADELPIFRKANWTGLFSWGVKTKWEGCGMLLNRCG